MDNFREWLSDNLRYILLGLAIILILVVAIFAVKFVSGLSSDNVTPKAAETEASSENVGETNTEGSTETNSESESEEPSSTLVKDEPAVLETVQAYYTAVGNKDIDTLSTLAQSLSEEDKQKILDNSVIESYNNISSYSTKGLEDGTYVVYVYYDGKISGIDTLVPSLSSLYLATNEDGSLYIVTETTEEMDNYVNQVSSQEEAKQLIKDVNEKCAQAEESDSALKEFMEQTATPETETVIPDSNETGIQANKVVAATTVCNVRSDSQETADIIGMLAEGETVTRVQTLDNGWSEIKYGETTGYVKSEFLTEDLPSQESES